MAGREARNLALKLMYITNDPNVSAIAQKSGVDRIFVDMEYIGKALRQGGMDTVQSHHTVEDVARIKKGLVKGELLVRCNPIHEKSGCYPGSEAEIEAVIRAGADMIMLPYFKTVQQVRRFLDCVAGRCRAMLLLETPEAFELADEILVLPGIDEVLVGLNDLSLGYGKRFMFELLADGTVEVICKKCAELGIPYGFGGIASLGKGMLPAEYIIQEHYRLGSGCAILSRSFCDVNRMQDLSQIGERFESGVRAIREYENFCRDNPQNYEQNRRDLVRIVDEIVERMKK